MKVSDFQYDLVGKGQGQIYLKSVLWIGVFMFSTMTAYRVQKRMKVSDFQYEFVGKGQGQIYLKICIMDWGVHI